MHWNSVSPCHWEQEHPLPSTKREHHELSKRLPLYISQHLLCDNIQQSYYCCNHKHFHVEQQTGFRLDVPTQNDRCLTLKTTDSFHNRKDRHQLKDWNLTSNMYAKSGSNVTQDMTNEKVSKTLFSFGWNTSPTWHRYQFVQGMLVCVLVGWLCGCIWYSVLILIPMGTVLCPVAKHDKSRHCISKHTSWQYLPLNPSTLQCHRWWQVTQYKCKVSVATEHFPRRQCLIKFGTVGWV